MKYLSIVIPVYNEEKRIAATLTRIVHYLAQQRYSYEIILVNDGSQDGTSRIAHETFQKLIPLMPNGQAYLMESKSNHGKGYSVKRGMLKSQGEFVLFSDADLSTPIEEWEKLADALREGYNVAIGSRALKGAQVLVRQNIMRESMGKFFNILVRGATGLPFVDTQCGFKLFDRQAVQKIFPLSQIHDFSFDVEVLYLALQHGLKVKEVPVVWVNSPESKVSVLRDPMNMFLSILRIRQLHPESSGPTALKETPVTR